MRPIGSIRSSAPSRELSQQLVLLTHSLDPQGRTLSDNLIVVGQMQHLLARGALVTAEVLSGVIETFNTEVLRELLTTNPQPLEVSQALSTALATMTRPEGYWIHRSEGWVDIGIPTTDRAICLRMLAQYLLDHQVALLDNVLEPYLTDPYRYPLDVLELMAPYAETQYLEETFDLLNPTRAIDPYRDLINAELNHRFNDRSSDEDLTGETVIEADEGDTVSFRSNEVPYEDDYLEDEYDSDTPSDTNSEADE